MYTIPHPIKMRVKAQISLQWLPYAYFISPSHSENDDYIGKKYGFQEARMISVKKRKKEGGGREGGNRV